MLDETRRLRGEEAGTTTRWVPHGVYMSTTGSEMLGGKLLQFLLQTTNFVV